MGEINSRYIIFLLTFALTLTSGQRPLTNSSQNNGLTMQPEPEKNAAIVPLEDLRPLEANPKSLRAYNSNGNSNQHSGNRGRKSSNNKMKEIRKAIRINNTDPKRPGDYSSGLMSYRPAYNHAKDLRPLNLLVQDDDPDSTNKDPFRVLKKKFKNDLQHRSYNQPQSNGEIEDILGVKCTFECETCCAWTWDESLVDGFQVVTGANLTEANRTGIMPGPPADPTQNANGHFLHLRLTQNTTQRVLKSPSFSSTLENCILELYTHQSAMSNSSLRIVIDPVLSQSGLMASDSSISSISSISSEIAGNDLNRWMQHKFRIDRVTKEFQILFEVVPNLTATRGHISIDNLKMKHCFPEGTKNEKCTSNQVQCTSNKVKVCITPNRICDLIKDCDDNEDELVNCDKIPIGGRCDFENGWCGWQNAGKAIMDWERHSGSTPTERTGPNWDHTFQGYNASGHYMFVNMNQTKATFASNAVMNSIYFNPPPSVHNSISSPYRNSCMVRFYIHQNALNAGSINLSVVEMKDKENITTTLWWSSKNQGPDWIRIDAILPNITAKYFMQFEARMGMRIYSDVAVDDFSLAPECFGLNIPLEDLRGYNYWDPHVPINKKAQPDFENKSSIVLSNCGKTGNEGPSQADCAEVYNNTDSIRILDRHPFKGMQIWKVPNEGYYTIIAKGAGGGMGSGGVGSSRGAVAVSVLELHKDEEIYILVGQSGEDACIKTMGHRDETCETKTEIYNNSFASKTQMVKKISIEDGAGGGGGATFVFLLNSANSDSIPLVVAGGGGGLGIGRYFDDDLQHGKGYNVARKDVSGQVLGDYEKNAGPGGGWHARPDSALSAVHGASLLEGGRGGIPCYAARGKHGEGGFGGGGGGCKNGGAGGGFSGGDIISNSSNGEGGTSYISDKRSIQHLNYIKPGANSGVGGVIIIPAIEGCGCNYRCVSLDEYKSKVECICPDGWQLRRDSLTDCDLIDEEEAKLKNWIIILVVLSVFFIGLFTLLITVLYNRYQFKKQARDRHKMLLEQDLQLSRLRSTVDDSALTNFNPNYGCDGILNGNVDVKSLPQVARESLRLVKALGQGAFGEVYQGLYRHRDGDAVEMPVAVKTLPEMSTGQAESDFLMEAAIMAKFNHPNIVHLIGVCFDRHPRFIVLELLAGGDLKNFLREGRNKPERPSPLTMKDLVFCALDVAKGCRYMEHLKFIHRDIAARNCLLSSKGPGRVVKIADFGMARDIYRSDYYRKGGKAMLPIKWMPPEAFLDGIFTSKTDVWSFGVLLWEVFSLGLMPYTGLANRDVMTLVTGGGRLDAPIGCPLSIYKIMADCWNPTPEARPTFSNILERVTATTQDPKILNAPLPSFFRAPSCERDATIMRPKNPACINDDFCLQIPSSDYLVPLASRSVCERLLSEATGVTIPSDTMTTQTTPKMTSPKLPKNIEDNNCWETSFMVSSSKSDQPLICNDNININSENGGQSSNTSVDKLISLDTPTTIQPPVSFGCHNDVQNVPSSMLILDPSNLIGSNYSNVGNFENNNKINPAQGFNVKNENHSEISC